MAQGYSAFSHKRTYSAGSYIYSPARLYFGILETTGDFNVYRGSSPDDPSKQKAWSTNTSAQLKAGSSVAITFFYTDYQMQHGIGSHKSMQIHAQDGSSSAYYLWEQPDPGTTDWQNLMEAFVVDDGTFGLRQNGTTLWSSGFSDPVAQYDVDSCSYDKSQVHEKPDSGDGNVIQEEYENKTALPQNFSLSKTIITTRTSSWSDTLGLKVSISAKGGASVPLVAKGELTVSTEISDSYTWSGSTSTADSVTISLPMVVPPGKKYRATAIIREVDFDVPYTMTGTLHFKSGVTVKRTVNGTYTGKNSYLAEGHIEDITDPKTQKAVFVMQGDALREAVLLPR